MTTKLSQVLSQLIEDYGTYPTELARRTGIAQPVIYRILTGETQGPNVKTLAPIADYFGITINQLIGDTPLPVKGSISYRSEDEAMRLPLVSWEQAVSWPEIELTGHADYILSSKNEGRGSYALTMKDTTMRPVFPEGAVLVIDALAQPRDKDYVVVQLKDHNEAMLKQVFFDGRNIILKPLNNDFKLIHAEKDNICFKGVVVESRMHFKRTS